MHFRSRSDQRRAAPSDRFMVALAVLNLMSEAAEVSPLVCLIDDAQWLDGASAQALGFVARRLLAERIAMVFAVREPGAVSELDGLPDLVVTGLPIADARLLLAAVAPGRLDELVVDRIMAEAQGNPLALLELPRGMTPADLAGGFGLLGPGALTSHVEQTFARRVDSLPPDSGRLMLIAAAEPLGDVTLLWRAAGRLRIACDAAAPAEAAGLVEFGSRLGPGIRWCARLSTEQLRRATAARYMLRWLTPLMSTQILTGARGIARTRPMGLDETVATELQRSAVRAQRRGGAAAAAAFLQRAAELTPDPARRGARALAGAEAKLDAADPDAASALLATADLCPLDRHERARAQRLRAEIVFSLSRGSNAVPLLLDAAESLADLDPVLARETYLEAFTAAAFAGRLGNLDQVRAAAAALLTAPTPTETSLLDPLDALLRGMATVLSRGYGEGVATFRLALEAFSRAEDDSADVNRWLWLACHLASELWDDQRWDELASRGVRVARGSGNLSLLRSQRSIAPGYTCTRASSRRLPC